MGRPVPTRRSRECRAHAPAREDPDPAEPLGKSPPAPRRETPHPFEVLSSRLPSHPFAFDPPPEPVRLVAAAISPRPLQKAPSPPPQLLFPATSASPATATS